MSKPQIKSVKIIERYDDHPDLSHLGEYSDTPRDGAIDRVGRGRNEYRYWNPGPNHYPHNPKSWDHVSENEVDKAIQENLPTLKRIGPAELVSALGSTRLLTKLTRAEKILWLDRFYVEQDYQRHEAHSRGDWHSVGVIAKAEIVVNGVIQTIRSGGLWGIESDSDPEYFEQVSAEELTNLKTILGSLGFGKRAIAHAFSSIEKTTGA